MQSAKQVLSIVLVLLMSSTTMFAQQALSNWSNVENLKPGTKIVVRTKNGREFVGTKRQSTDDTLFMEARFPVQGVRTISLSKDEIQEVRKNKSTFFYPLLGLAIGIGVGVAIGSTADHPGTDDPNLGKILGGVLGGGIGLTAGEGISRRPKTKQIYVAP
ncbi:MAG TPA: hypothetical protein DC054_13690 [Blastocatellia bacterium]|nr:hypothetical protein [Blastocatellia bacterium]